MILFVSSIPFTRIQCVNTIGFRVRPHALPPVRVLSLFPVPQPNFSLDSLRTGLCGPLLRRCLKPPSQVNTLLTSLEQLADWLEAYAKVMELNVWTSSTVTSAEQGASGTWTVNVTRVLPDGTETKRVLHPTHLVFATGLGGGSWAVPKFPEQVLLPLIFSSYCP